MPEPKKQCPVCASTKPISCFDEDPGTPGQRVDLCKDCISEMLTKSLRTKSLETSARNDEVLRRGLEGELMAIQPMASDGDYCPDISAMTGEIVRLFGGAKGLARNWMSTYLATDPESHSRVKMMSEMRAMVERTTDEGKTKTLDSMSDSELKDHRERLMKQLLMSIAQGQVNQLGKFTEQAPERPQPLVLEAVARVVPPVEDDDLGIDVGIGEDE